MSELLKSEQQIRDFLRSRGLRVTLSRIKVVAILQTIGKPSSLREISEHPLSGKLDKATICRILNDLTKAGFLRRFDLGDHTWRYERVSSEPATWSIHLLCVDCGDIVPLKERDVVIHFSSSIGSVEGVMLKGHCKECQDVVR